MTLVQVKDQHRALVSKMLWSLIAIKAIRPVQYQKVRRSLAINNPLFLLISHSNDIDLTFLGTYCSMATAVQLSHISG